MFTRVLSGSVIWAWPALFLADHLPPDALLGGKGDDVLTGGIVAVLFVGLLAAGRLRPLWPALLAVLLLGFAVPVVYEAVRFGRVGSFVLGLGVLCAVIGVVLVTVGAGVRRLARSSPVPLLPRGRRSSGGW